MADESTIRATLAAYAPLTALISTRLWDETVPTNVVSPVTRPFVVMTVASDVPFNLLAAAPGGAAMRIQIDIYADTKASAKAVLSAIRAALHAAGHYGCEVLTQNIPADDPTLRRISSDWSFVLAR